MSGYRSADSAATRPRSQPGALTAPVTLEEIQREHFDSRTTPQRTGAVGWLMPTIPLALGLLGLVPAAAPILRVDRWEHLGAMVYLSSIMTAATWLWLRGSRPVYRVIEVVETCSMMATYCVLVARSGQGLSVFWLYFLAHVMAVGQMGHLVGLHTGVILALPTAVGLRFAHRGDLFSTTVSLLVAIVGVMTYLLLAMSTRGALAAEFERRRQAEIEAHEERNKLARDLHDGLGAELTSLLWRARRLGVSSSGPDGHPALLELATRVEQSLGSLREVVQGLRRETIAWPALIDELRQRSRQLAGVEAEVTLEATAPPTPPVIDGELRLDLSLMVQESVNNAIRHGHAKHVTIVLEASDRDLVLRVDDDGAGLPEAVLAQGGPRSLRERVQALGGTFTVRAGAGRIEARLPWRPGAA